MLNLITGGTYAVFLFLHRFFGLFEFNSFSATGFVAFLLILAMHASSFYYPLYLVKTQRDNILNAVSQFKVPLHDVLVRVELQGFRIDFAEHLAREFSLENLLFWDAARRYESEWASLSVDDARTQALGIYDRFVVPGSSHEVKHVYFMKRVLSVTS